MIERDDLSSRLKAVKESLEAISAGQRYNFRSLTAKRSIMPGDYDFMANVTSANTHIAIVATSPTAKLLPLVLDVRYRVGNASVLDAPDYDTPTRFVSPLRHPPSLGYHRLDIHYYTASFPQTVYFKVVGTGVDDYTIQMVSL